MQGIPRPILFDADVIILFLEWNVFSKVFNKLGPMGALSEAVLLQVKGHKDRVSGRWRRFDPLRVTSSSAPRLVRMDQLTEEQYEAYLAYVSALKGAHTGEKETFALAWVLSYDVCSQDVGASDFFFQHRPKESQSRHLHAMDVLRRLGLA